MIKYECRSTKRRQGPIRLVSHADLEVCRGFRSVYGWHEDAVQHILTTRSTAGLKYFNVYADELLLDFDNNLEAADAAECWLKQRNITYTKWHSGGRSIHFHIKTVPMDGVSVPYSHKQFVAENFPGADLSFYNASGMYRLPWTAHESNPGQFKLMLDHNYGRALEIPLLSAPSFFKPRAENKDGDKMLLTMMMFKTLRDGEGRNRHVYNMSKVAQECGYDYDSALEIATLWNDSCAIPSLGAGELVTTVRSAYKAYGHIPQRAAT